jgi:hypothetical protein
MTWIRTMSVAFGEMHAHHAISPDISAGGD